MESTLLEWAKLLVDLLKAYAYPAAIVAVIWFFREEIRKRFAEIRLLFACLQLRR